MTGGDLASLADLWLTGKVRSWTLRFPARLEAAFERDSGADRNRTLAVLTLGATLAFLLWDISGLLSDIAAGARAIHALAMAPINIVAAYAFWRGLKANTRELLASALAVFSATSLVALFVSGAWLSAGLCSTGVIVTILLATLVIQLRVPYAVASVAIMLSLLLSGLLIGPADAAPELRKFLPTAIISAAIALLASWRQEREFRRAYLMGLKERLRLRALGQRNRELDVLTRRDPLTGLPNRRAFDLWLEDPGVHTAAPWSLIAIDIDHFKAYNDLYGHPAGDQCLRDVSTCLRTELRGVSDLFARIGGEEFAVLLPTTRRAAAAGIAERLRQAVTRMAVPHAAPEACGHVTISAGVAQVSVSLEVESAALIAAADAALYEAKRQGRDRVCEAETVRSEAK
jgi:diguanylate cyclase (GGDEF)-like protein